MDLARIRERLKNELYAKVEHEINSGERKTYELKLKEWEARYHAKRSIKGLLLTGVEDPEEAPLQDPYEGTADIGHPISMTLTQELVPNVMAAHLGMIPYTETKKIDKKGMQPYGVVDDFLYYMMTQAKLRKTRRETVLSGYKYADAPEKVIIEPKTRMVTENRILLSTKAKKPKVLFDLEGKEIEVFGDEDIRKKMVELVSGDDPRSEYFRYAQRKPPEGLGLSPNQALEAAGIEIKGKEDDISVRVAPMEQPGKPDWNKSTTYYQVETPVTEEIMVNPWPQIINIHPKDFIVPSGVETNDIMDYWNCHRYTESLGWLIQRKGDGEGEGFYPETVDQIVEMFNNRRKDEKSKKKDIEPEIWEVYENFVLEDEDENDDNYMVGTEIVVWFCPDYAEDPVLGWQVNPAVRFPMEHIRPIFVFRPKPEPHRYHGLCIPETAIGSRDMSDWLLNGRLNREAMYSDPILLESKNTFDRQEKSFGGGCQRWIKEQGEVLEVLKLNTPEGQSIGDEMLMIQVQRLLWGASEQMSGQRTKTDSGTATEANLLAAKGAQMFQDTVESISQTADLEFEYIKNFYVYSDPGALKFPARPDTDNPDGSTIEVTRKLLEGPMIIHSRRVLTEAEREVKMTAVRIVFEFLGQLQSPMLKSPKFTTQMINELFDALNWENIEVPTEEELQQEMAKIQKMSQEMIEKERYFKALEGEKDKGARNIVQKFLERNAPGANQAGTAIGGV